MEIGARLRRVALGQTFLTPQAADALHPVDVADALRRHARGDWGEVCAADIAENEISLKEGFRLLSAYTDRSGVKFWIITEWDRFTTVLLMREI